MKKVIIGMSLIFTLGLFGCAEKKVEVKPEVKNTTEVKQEVKTEEPKTEVKTETESEFKFPEGAKPVGKGTIYVSTPGGTSENNNVPVLMLEKDTSVIQIGLDASNFDGSKVSYIYINKKFIDKMQLGEMTQTSIDLQGDLLKAGVYTVSVVQFENDDVNGKVTQFVETKYEVKEL